VDESVLSAASGGGARRSTLRGFTESVSILLRFLRRLIAKAIRDDIFFLSGAIAFNLVMAVVPLLVLAVGVTGYVLQSRFIDPAAQVTVLLDRVLPGESIDPQLVESVAEIATRAVEARTGFSVVGSILLLLVATRLAATLRSVLRVVFDIHVRRGLIRGKLFDVRLVLSCGLVILANLVLVAAVTGQGLTEAVIGYPLTIVTLWLLFVIVYRTVPPERPRWIAVFVASFIAAATFELLKAGFRWYFTEVASLRTTSGGVVAMIVLLVFLYYSAMVFVAAGQAGYLITHPDFRSVRLDSPLPEPLEPGSADRRRPEPVEDGILVDPPGV